MSLKETKTFMFILNIRNFWISINNKRKIAKFAKINRNENFNKWRKHQQNNISYVTHRLNDL